MISESSELPSLLCIAQLSISIYMWNWEANFLLSESALHMGLLMFPAGISCTTVGPKCFKFNYLDTLLSAVILLLFSLQSTTLLMPDFSYWLLSVLLHCVDCHQIVPNKNPQMPKGYFKHSVSNAGFISPFILLSHYQYALCELIVCIFYAAGMAVYF